MYKKTGAISGKTLYNENQFKCYTLESTIGINHRFERFLKESCYCKTHYYRAPFKFTRFTLGDDTAYITGADIHSK